MKIEKIVCIILLVLLIPFIAMQFTNEVNWSLGDFVVAGLVLLGTALAIRFISLNVTKKEHKIILIIIIAIGLLLLWAELAVGIFGSAVAGS